MELPETLVFDVNETLLDLQPVRDTITEALGGNPHIARVWFRTLLHYSLVESVTDHWLAFSEIAAATLQMVAREEGIQLEEEEAMELVSPLLTAPPHADVPEALERLQKMGYRLCVLTNSDREALAQQLQHAGLDHFFAAQYSVSTWQTYKPALSVYRWVCRQEGLAPPACMMVAAHAWDLTGAARAGMQTAFLLRPGKQWYPKGPSPDMVCTDLAHFVNQLALKS